jgi:site-specific DNA-methyltransferase (adenine-specific)
MINPYSTNLKIGSPQDRLISNVYHMDCVEGMKQFPDKYFDLAVVDPPYGMPKDSTHGRGKLKNRILNNGGVEQWDIKPTSEYFNELFRVSKDQIVWGGNYFGLPETRGFLVWDKEQPFENFSAAEYAWMSFQTVSKIFRLATTRTGDDIKIHPTQKPIKLYNWVFKNYATAKMKILDTHLGSGSSRIAAYDSGMDFYGFEIDDEYIKGADKRFKAHISQQKLFYF